MVYQGSKARVAKYICPIIQKYIDETNAETFIDAFCGGANVIQHISARNKIGYDTNPYLIALLNNLDKIESVEVPISREHYNDVKAAWRQRERERVNIQTGILVPLALLLLLAESSLMVAMLKTHITLTQNVICIPSEKTISCAKQTA